MFYPWKAPWDVDPTHPADRGLYMAGSVLVGWSAAVGGIVLLLLRQTAVPHATPHVVTPVR